MVTYGFYDSLNHDRRYNAIQFGSIFDGIIRDGIFMSIGTCFRVTPGEGMMLLVGIGRAWFDHTWTLNDAPLPIYIPQSEVILDRIDAVVIDVHSDQSVRKNDIIVVKGTPSKTPTPPAMIKTTYHHQYPLAYISVKAGVTSIRAADITSRIGTSDSPYVTGILETVNIDALLAKWEDQWNVFFEFWEKEWAMWYLSQTAEIQESYLAWEAEWEAWFAEHTGEIEETAQYWKSLWAAWFYSYTNSSHDGLNAWIENTENDIMDWWNSIKDMLNENCCAECAQKILDLEKRASECEEFRNALLTKQEMYDIIYDTQYDKDLGYLTNQDNVEITNEYGDIITLAGERSEPILDDEMDPLKSTMKIAIL